MKQTPYLVKAEKIRMAAKNQGSALDRALRRSFEECGGPWGLSASLQEVQADTSDGLAPGMRPADWPIARVHIVEQMKKCNPAEVWAHW